MNETTEAKFGNIEVKHLDLHQIKPYWNNPRDNEIAVDAVAESIKQFGYQNPIVVDSDHVIIAGDTRYRALKSLGFGSVDVIVSSMTQDQAHGYRVIDNKTSEKARWNQDKLVGELRRYSGVEVFQAHFPELSISIPKMDHSIPGFSEQSITNQASAMETRFADISRARATEIKKYVCPHCGNEFEAI